MYFIKIGVKPLYLGRGTVKIDFFNVIGEGNMKAKTGFRMTAFLFTVMFLFGCAGSSKMVIPLSQISNLQFCVLHN